MAELVREKVDNKIERDIIRNAITSTEYMERVYRLLSPEYFKAPFAQTVYKWCQEYYSNYKKAPNKDIQELYIMHKARLESDEVDLISTFLSSLSKEHDGKIDNLDFVVKQSTDWANMRSLELVYDKLKMAIANKDFSQGEQALASFKKIKEVVSDSTDMLNDVQEIANAFEHENEFLFRFPGAAGDLIGDINRTDFVGFLGFLKSGKSFFLLEAARQAQMAGLNVLVVHFEMPKRQVLKRLWQPMVGKPKYKRMVKLPYFFTEDDDEKFHIGVDEIEMEGYDPSKEEILAMVKNHRKYHPKGDIRLMCYPSMSMTVDELKQAVANIRYYDDFNPDVIVIDYADLMRSNVRGERRHQLYDIWASLRGWALADNMAIISASQAGRTASNNDASEENIAEDISKLAHVTKMIAINSTKEERAKGLRRLAVVATRDEEQIFEQVYVLTCLELGIPIVDSKFRSEIYSPKKEEK